MKGMEYKDITQFDGEKKCPTPEDDCFCCQDSILREIFSGHTI